MKNCSYCGRENEDTALECLQCERDEFLVRDNEGKMRQAPPPGVTQGAARIAVICNFQLREARPDAPSRYRTVASTWGGLKRGFLTVDDQYVVLRQRLGPVAALLIGLLTLVTGLVVFAVCVGIISSVFHLTPEDERGIEPAINLVWILVFAVPFLCAWWIRRFHRRFSFGEIVGCEARDNEMVLQLRQTQPDKQLALKFFRTADFLLLAERLSAAGVKIDESIEQTKQVINDFAADLKAATPNNWVTIVLAIVNVAVYAVLLVVQNGGISPTASVLTEWGANYGPLTVHGNQWWRLLACCFLHANILHLAFNMYALIQVGRLTEKLFGNWFFLLIYLGCGIMASLTSLWSHPAIPSVGASGAIFGIYGALVGYLIRQHTGLPRLVARSVWQSAIIFFIWNLIYNLNALEANAIGSSGGVSIDVAAHVGGLLSGIVFGYLGARPLDLHQRRNLAYNRGVALAAAIGLAVALLFIPVIHG
jgi:rhomboid protease GluP